MPRVASLAAPPCLGEPDGARRASGSKQRARNEPRRLCPWKTRSCRNEPTPPIPLLATRPSPTRATACLLIRAGPPQVRHATGVATLEEMVEKFAGQVCALCAYRRTSRGRRAPRRPGQVANREALEVEKAVVEARLARAKVQQQQRGGRRPAQCAGGHAARAGAQGSP